MNLAVKIQYKKKKKIKKNKMFLRLKKKNGQ